LSQLPCFGVLWTSSQLPCQLPCFAWQNAHWLLVGLDSAYHEHDLAMNQADWLEGLVAAARNGKVVLFTHHQPYSLIEKQGTKLVEKLSGLLESRRIFAWYWGHEHRCVIYDAREVLALFGGKDERLGFFDTLGRRPPRRAGGRLRGRA
jgi:hypothetical protein